MVPKYASERCDDRSKRKQITRSKMNLNTRLATRRELESALRTACMKTRDSLATVCKGLAQPRPRDWSVP
jgi:hypothetical protein